MVTYSDIKEIFENKNCKLDMTEEEFNEKKRYKTEKYKYIASCGHSNEVWLNVFLNRNTGVKCRNCIITENKNKAKEKTKVGTKPLLDLEYHSIMYLKSIISDYFDIKTTFEGCLADIAIKPKNINDDSWLMIQVKTTYKPTRGYSFKCMKSYNNCLLFCLCNSDKKMWLFNYNNDINIQDKISIGLKKSKYDRYEVTKENILENIKNYYNNMNKYSFDFIDTPISDCQKLEREYRKYRENKLSFLNFEYPIYQGSVYDFMINNLKIQEKVGTHVKGKKSILFSLNKNNGMGPNRKRQLTSYKKCDNDFYWLNMPDKKYFYVIPESILIEKKYIDTPKQKSICINPNKESWISQYQFEYDNVNIEKLQSIFI